MVLFEFSKYSRDVFTLVYGMPKYVHESYAIDYESMKLYKFLRCDGKGKYHHRHFTIDGIKYDSLTYAIEKNREKMVKFILETGFVMIHSTELLHKAVRNNNYSLIDELTKKRGCRSRISIHNVFREIINNNKHLFFNYFISKLGKYKSSSLYTLKIKNRYYKKFIDCSQSKYQEESED